jgi:hypothetical protein
MKTPLSLELERLRSEDADLAEVLDAFEEIEHAYAEVLDAMSGRENQPPVTNSADVTISMAPLDESLRF